MYILDQVINLWGDTGATFQRRGRTSLRDLRDHRAPRTLARG